jgi:hypothetical protein
MEPTRSGHAPKTISGQVEALVMKISTSHVEECNMGIRSVRLQSWLEWD